MSVDIITLEKSSELIELFDIIGETLDSDGQIFIRTIVSKIEFPLSVVIEHHYVDRVYRDSYYRYFSSKHFDFSRICKRLSIFNGEITKNDFYSVEGQKKLQQSVIGFIVIRPISPGCIGRTLINPFKLKDFSGYVRTTEFSFEVLGTELRINAFPFSSQDTETMTCAETTVWNIVEYFGNRYKEYKITVPSEMLSILSEHSNERVIPTRGLHYEQVAGLLKSFGFSPRIYFQDGGDPNELKRLFHYYVESGIPIGVAVNAKYNGVRVGHSIVCIGHDKIIDKNPKVNNINSISFIDSADMYNNYILMDDNTYPYMVRNFNNFTLYDKPTVCGFVVPLYSRIFLEARDAYEIAINILANSEFKLDTDTINFEGYTYSKNDNPILIRLYLTTSRHYKKFKALNSPNEFMRNVYTTLRLPRFIWVAEISLKNLFLEKSKVFGEVVIDATASRYNSLNSLVLLHYPKRIGWRNPDEPLTNIFNMISLDNEYADCCYQLYQSNLSEGV